MCRRGRSSGRGVAKVHCQAGRKRLGERKCSGRRVVALLRYLITKELCGNVTQLPVHRSRHYPMETPWKPPEKALKTPPVAKPIQNWATAKYYFCSNAQHGCIGCPGRLAAGILRLIYADAWVFGYLGILVRPWNSTELPAVSYSRTHTDKQPGAHRGAPTHMR